MIYREIDRWQDFFLLLIYLFIFAGRKCLFNLNGKCLLGHAPWQCEYLWMGPRRRNLPNIASSSDERHFVWLWDCGHLSTRTQVLVNCAMQFKRQHWSKYILKIYLVNQTFVWWQLDIWCEYKWILYFLKLLPINHTKLLYLLFLLHVVENFGRGEEDFRGHIKWVKHFFKVYIYVCFLVYGSMGAHSDTS